VRAGITSRQQDCLEAVKAFRKRMHRMPSLDEIATMLGLASRSGASSLLTQLEKRGYVKRVPGSARAITLRKTKCPHCGNDLASLA
jgi:SOS-response transcriptional repressor LexA